MMILIVIGTEPGCRAQRFNFPDMTVPCDVNIRAILTTYFQDKVPEEEMFNFLVNKFRFFTSADGMTTTIEDISDDPDGNVYVVVEVGEAPDLSKGYVRHGAEEN